jgi:FKBP-type peptidyl-prolyl cis-trans isomerase
VRQKLVLIVSMLSAAVLLVSCAAAQEPEQTGEQQQATAAEAPDNEKVFYAIGVALAGNLKVFEASEEERAALLSGIEDSLAPDAEPKYPREELQALLQQAQTLQQERMQQQAAKEKEAGAAVIEEVLASEEAAEQYDSGLVMLKLQEGTGASPAATDQVRVHYHGTLPDGEVFDSSRDRGEPAEFPLNRVIPCWTEALQKMKVGGKARIYCPSDIAYGDQPRPGSPIPGGATLIFEVELLDIVEQPAPQSPATGQQGGAGTP